MGIKIFIGFLIFICLIKTISFCIFVIRQKNKTAAVGIILLMVLMLSSSVIYFI